MKVLRAPHPHNTHCSCSVSQSCLTICDPMDCSTPGFPVLHHLPELTQTHIHWVSDAIQPSHPVACPQSFSFSRSFPVSQLFKSGSQNIGASALAPALPMNIWGWLPLGLTGLISLQSNGLSRVLSRPQFESIISLALSLLYGPTLMSMYDYWKKHSFDYMDLCQQSDMSAF